MNKNTSFRYKHFLRTMKKLDIANLIPKFTFDQYRGQVGKYQFQCKICNFEFSGSFSNNRISRCPICHPNRLTKNYGHESSVDIKCKNCGRIFNIEWEYRNHIFC